MEFSYVFFSPSLQIPSVESNVNFCDASDWSEIRPQTAAKRCGHLSRYNAACPRLVDINRKGLRVGTRPVMDEWQTRSRRDCSWWCARLIHHYTRRYSHSQTPPDFSKQDGSSRANIYTTWTRSAASASSLEPRTGCRLITRALSLILSFHNSRFKTFLQIFLNSSTRLILLMLKCWFFFSGARLLQNYINNKKR